jgi:hypothetical protein
MFFFMIFLCSSMHLWYYHYWISIFFFIIIQLFCTALLCAVEKVQLDSIYYIVYILFYYIGLYVLILALTFFYPPRWLSTGFHSFFRKSSSHLKILCTISWHEASSLLRTHSSGVTCEPHCYLVLGRITPVIILKILGTTVQNLIGWLTR